MQADAGTITEEDIKFIKTLREDTPKLVIVNKADKKNLKDLKEIISKIKASLDIKGVRYVDVFAFTSRINQVENEELCSFIEADTEKIKKQIESWNRQVYESNFARNFKILFVRCREFYEDEIDEESRKLVRLNTSITKLSVEDVDSEILEPLQSMVRDAQKTVNELKDIREKLKELQDDFFTEIKFISDVVGIAMPEPSEIDLLQDNVQNPMELIAEYKKEKNIQTDPSIGDMLQGVFEGIEPVINKRPGGSEYRDELLDIILAACNVETEEIHIHDCVKNTEEYAELCKLEHESVKIGNIFGRTEEYAGIVKLQ